MGPVLVNNLPRRQIVHVKDEAPSAGYRTAGADSPLQIPANQGECSVVFELFVAIVGALRAAFRPRVSLVAENLALRQQLAVLRRKTKRPQLVPVDRPFWVVLSRIWSRWA